MGTVQVLLSWAEWPMRQGFVRVTGSLKGMDGLSSTSSSLSSVTLSRRAVHAYSAGVGMVALGAVTVSRYRYW